MTASQQEVKAQVQTVLKLMKPEWKWAAMDEDLSWVAYADEPLVDIDSWEGYNDWSVYRVEWCQLKMFNLPPFPGDWRESLVVRE